ncbi:uncharacterized protein LOC111445784 [Cucurbita moschata]|uniref:Uncharacterized protein LOC111445784 n=1 Tax=Cucurbita moschata TaxID=3662 RepID=A0A6J1FPE4_CUCMO|nr:uncharacterized protein LOC111445784 [Cucurbita moschata]
MPPRQGSRPFECVRRAWHCERHQPIRGSLIQEIFRVVSQVHCPATKKNKEWQEKLPIVVLKAEEILYSKADSEAEYMDITTLWTRINEAINTIIRLDGDTETGEFLHPCIEAALYLGCTPRRSSRSNRGSNLRGYLTSCSPQVLETSSHYLNTIRPAVLSSSCTIPDARPKSQIHVGNPIGVSTNSKSSTVYKNIWPSISSQQFLTETVSGWNMFSLCPLYNGSNQHEPGINIQPMPLYNDPSFSVPAPFKYFHSSELIAARHNNVDSVNTLHEQQKTACNLSLRLGPLSIPHPSMNNDRSKSITDIGANDSQNQMTSSSGHPFQLDKTLPFFPLHVTLDSHLKEQSFKMDI